MKHTNPLKEYEPVRITEYTATLHDIEKLKCHIMEEINHLQQENITPTTIVLKPEIYHSLTAYFHSQQHSLESWLQYWGITNVIHHHRIEGVRIF